MTSPAWRCPHPLSDVLLAWEGEQHAVFFDPVAGDTHLIAALGAQLAEWLAAEPLTRAQLLARLATEVEWDEPPAPDALAELLDLHLQRLADIHLLTREPVA
ncbi:HPr-rel-A system PqqD family peptide chaperone [Roseateles chitosanitabidus]|uniref:HPr-rel-A system PqqD family peptide chaperone n=1 Tax=Roseateles chitosanitabidus TaxID=65048 RepID=UPI000831A30B|nr:HPr-rel-A system PqqD family peptide chaperone [Roseateles chitosanitabidus]MBO9688395.1 HPr-rel-A system PqqD family peptide chaperone [Roseateles chitosanitabidus]